jgi:dTDP-4-dehydrorhamnose 3,5-epimerase
MTEFIRAQAIPDIKVLEPRKWTDDRGFFSETYSRQALAAAGLDLDFVQDNHAYSAEPWTLRGLHFQTAPFAQAKLIRVVRGAIFDVAVDLRAGSPTRGQWVSVVLSAENWKQILIPTGFAHGLLTLEPHTEVLYKVTAPYAPDHDRGLAWDDPALAIDWPLEGHVPILSAKDRNQPRWADLPALLGPKGESP